MNTPILKHKLRYVVLSIILTSAGYGLAVLLLGWDKIQEHLFILELWQWSILLFLSIIFFDLFDGKGF